MGVQSGKVEQPKAFVACQGSYDNTSDKYKYEGISSCKACNALYSGPTLCRYGCLGYGDCTRVCKFDAIRVVNGVAKVDREKCTGCGACAKVCPDGIIHMIPENEKPVVMCANKDKGAVTRKNCSHGCIGCKKCEKLCPNGAITVTDNVAFIDMEKCDGCLKCMEGCPVKAINVPPKTCDFQ
nr:4Fe-4S binding protein [Feifania hominis]